MFTTGLCAPALVYIGFSLIQIFIDIFKGVINSAFLKFIIMLVFTLIINILCDLGYSVIAWFLVFIPIIMMTVISTLLLRVFGLDPQEKELQSKIKNLKDGKDINSDDLYLKNSELLKLNENRIDRDKLRHTFYDNVDNYYDLSYNDLSYNGKNYLSNNDKYDLSNNPTKYFIINTLIHHFAEYSFVQNIYNSRLYNTIFSDNLTSFYDAPLYNKYIESRSKSTDLPAINMSVGKNNSNNKTKTNDFTSYSDKYSDENKLDGFILFKSNKYANVKQELMKTNPQITDAQIDKKIEFMWNNLLAAEQDTWNNSKDANKANATKNKKKGDYDATNLNSYNVAKTQAYISSLSKYEDNTVCPSNETPITFKSKTGLDCYEVCPPGKLRNPAGECK